MCDEVTDVASRKHLATLCRYLGPNKEVKVAFLNDVEIPNGKAETITQCLTSELQSRSMSLTKMSSLAADGASTFSGSTSGVV